MLNQESICLTLHFTKLREDTIMIFFACSKKIPQAGGWGNEPGLGGAKAEVTGEVAPG